MRTSAILLFILFISCTSNRQFRGKYVLAEGAFTFVRSIDFTDDNFAMVQPFQGEYEKLYYVIKNDQIIFPVAGLTFNINEDETLTFIINDGKHPNVVYIKQSYHRNSDKVQSDKERMDSLYKLAEQQQDTTEGCPF